MTTAFVFYLVALILFLVAAFEAVIRTRGPIVWGWLGLAAFVVPSLMAVWPTS